ncbi:MAG: O-antigen ligase family protein [Pseudomonadota bacterium]
MTHVWTLRSVGLFGLMALTLLVVATPGYFVQAGLLTTLLFVVLFAVLFPEIVLGAAVFSLVLSPENFYLPTNFVAQHFGGLTVHSVHKLLFLVAVIPSVLRLRFKFDLNPGAVAMGLLVVISFVFSTTFPELTNSQTIRSIIALALPFLFFSLVVRPYEIDRFLLLIALLPIASLVIGFIFQLLAVEDVFRRTWHVLSLEFTGATRLRGVNIAAYLAYFCFISYFVCLYQALVYNRRLYYVIGALVLIILFFTGTRTPTALVVLMSGMAILFTGSGDLNVRSKFGLSVIGIMFVSILLALYWPNLEARMFNNEFEGGIFNTSGRQAIWPIFQEAIAVNPLFGRGLGTGAIILLLDQRTEVASAHNEYLRLLVDVGVVGLIVYVVGLVACTLRERKYYDRSQWTMFIAVLLALAAYSYTDNTLTSPPTLVLFFAISLFVQKARYEKEGYYDDPYEYTYEDAI